MEKIIPYGDQALLINFDQKIRTEINQQVVDLHQAILKAAPPGVNFMIPAYCSLVVGYKPHETTFPQLKTTILEQMDIPGDGPPKKSRLLSIPVCYQDPCSLDMSEVEQRTGLIREQIIEIHTGKIFQIFMLGFLPGFPYMGPLPSSLYCDRKTSPRLRVPSRSVGLASHQTGIYPCQAPGGWQIIGQTPLEIFQGQKPQPFLFQTGDQVRFRSISLAQYQEDLESVRSEKFNWDTIYEQP